MTLETLHTEIQTFLEKLGVEVSEITISSKQRTLIALKSSSPDLIGPHGEHLQAINTLFKRLVEKKYGEAAANFLVDVNEFHESKMEKVRQNARLLAQKAKVFKHDVELEPASSYERLVIHELFSEDPQIETVSEGEGKFRHIVLKYKV